MTQLVELRGVPPAIKVLKETADLREFPKLYAERDRLDQEAGPHLLTLQRFALRSV